MAGRTILNGPFKDLAYWISGEGPAILWVHGFAEDVRIWDRLMLNPLPGFTHITLNLPGTGTSPLPAACSIEAMADALHTILQQESISRCILLGHSMGGYIGIAFAAKYPEHLMGLGFIHSSVYADDDTKKINRGKAIDIIRSGGKGLFLQQVVASLYGPKAHEAYPERVQAHFNMAMTIPEDTLIAYYQAMMKRPNHANTVQQLECPVLYVLGEFDQAVPLTVGLEQSLLPAITSVHILPGVGHTAMNEAPEILQDILNNYCQYALRFKKS